VLLEDAQAVLRHHRALPRVPLARPIEVGRRERAAAADLERAPRDREPDRDDLLADAVPGDDRDAVRRQVALYARRKRGKASRPG